MKNNKFIKIIFIVFFALSLTINSAKSIDPPYQAQMERLTNILGSLYYLQPLCGYNEIDWRKQVATLIMLEKPTKDRKQRLAGAFNEGFQTFARIYNICTPSAKEAMERFLQEGASLAKYIHTQFAE